MAIQILGNPWDSITGCTKISPGCKHCYAERFTNVLTKSQPKYKAGFYEVVCHPYVINHVKRKGNPQTYFVNSMADTFHTAVPIEFIQLIFKRMNDCPQHTFQVLTKRTDRMLEIQPFLEYTQNIWQGASIERKDYLYRIDDLRESEAHTKFLMIEPLLGSLGEIDLAGIDWVIVGGESGENFRPMKIDWVREIRDQCIDQNVKFVFKQWAAKYPIDLGRQLDGKIWDERPLYESEKQTQRVIASVTDEWEF